jgi:hypothetical protein
MATNDLILVDEKKKQFVRISASQMEAFVTAQRALIDSMEPARRQNLLPKLTREWDAQKQDLSLSSLQLTYAAKLVKPQSPELASKYRHFTDWMARYNAIKGLPPSSRLQLNQQAASLGLVPREIRKTVLADSLRTTHRYYLGWRERDRQRVDQITKTYPQFRELDLSAVSSIGNATFQR